MMAAHPLPNCVGAIIEDSKLVDYALSPESERGRHKAHVFERALGFTRANWQDLKRAILDALPRCDAAPQPDTPFGKKYTVVVPVTGPNGRSADVLTVWQYDRLPDGTLRDVPRLVTLYLPSR
jgi:hypothetical protein